MFRLLHVFLQIGFVKKKLSFVLVTVFCSVFFLLLLYPIHIITKLLFIPLSYIFHTLAFMWTTCSKCWDRDPDTLSVAVDSSRCRRLSYYFGNHHQDSGGCWRAKTANQTISLGMYAFRGTTLEEVSSRDQVCMCCCIISPRGSSSITVHHTILVG